MRKSALTNKVNPEGPRNRFVLTRDVAPSECFWLIRTYRKGETVYKAYGYGRLEGGAVFTEQPRQLPFFELPGDALEGVG